MFKSITTSSLKRVLEEHGWNFSRAAVALNVSRSTLYLKANKYGLAGRRAHAATGPMPAG